jgi:hypothetical protein
MEDFSVARYLFDQRPDGRYVPKVSILQPDHSESSSPILKAVPIATLTGRCGWISGC